jgi:hypothetical protein
MIIGITSDSLPLDQMEKRVRSRFSHRVLLVPTVSSSSDAAEVLFHSILSWVSEKDGLSKLYMVVRLLVLDSIFGGKSIISTTVDSLDIPNLPSGPSSWSID